MNLDSVVIAALIGLIAGLCGAVLQYLYSRHLEAKKHFQEIRTHAYVDFLRAVAGISIAQRFRKDDEEFVHIIALADARSRLAIYASKNVARSTAEFFEKFGNLSSEAAVSAYVSIGSQMRMETPTHMEEISESELRVLLIGSNS